MKDQSGKSQVGRFRILLAQLRPKVERRSGLVKILDNIGWLFFDRILRMGVGLFLGILMARYLGPEQFGLLNYGIAFVALFGAGAGLGLNGIVVRDIVNNPHDAQLTLGTAFILQSFAGLFATLLVIAIISLMKPEDNLTRNLVVIMSLGLMFKATDVIKYWYEARVQSRSYILIETGVYILMAIIRIAMIMLEASLTAFVWLTLIESLIVACALVWLYSTHSNFLNLFHASKRRARTLMQDAWPLFLAAITVSLYMRIDVVMLEAMSNSREVGIYAAAARISEIWYFVPMVIVSSVSPYLVTLFLENRSLYLLRLRRLYFLMFWLSTVGYGLTFYFSELIIATLFGADYNGAASVLAIHSWSGIAVFLGVASSQYLLIEQMQKYSLYRTIIGAVANIALNFALIPTMGAEGAATATLISYFIATYSLIFFKATRRHAVTLLMAPFTFK